MIPNISLKSAYIIFIIIINIVSMVYSFYQPIKKKDIDSKKNLFLYINYLEANVLSKHKLLNVDQFYESYFNYDYRVVPGNEFDTHDTWMQEIIKYCNNEYIARKSFKKNNEILEFARILLAFQKCLSFNENIIKGIKLCFKEERKEPDAKCLEAILGTSDKKKVSSCLEKFGTKVEELFKIFQDDKETSKKIMDFKFETNSLGVDSVKAFKTVLMVKADEEFNDASFESFRKYFKEFTSNNKNTDSKDNYGLYQNSDPDYSYARSMDSQFCIGLYQKYPIEDYEIIISFMSIFRGFKTLYDFKNQSLVALKYIESLEGLLVNNSELYDIYRQHPISEEDYKELRRPFPLIHEKLYLLYTLRLTILGYVPMPMSIWDIEMKELQDEESCLAEGHTSSKLQ